MEVLTFKALIDSDIGHDDFVSVNVLKKYNDMREEFKNPKIINSENR